MADQLTCPVCGQLCTLNTAGRIKRHVATYPGEPGWTWADWKICPGTGALPR